MEIVDHLTLELGTFRLFAVHLLEFILAALDEILDLALVDEDIVGCDADLTRVNGLSECNFSSSEINLSTVIND